MPQPPQTLGEAPLHLSSHPPITLSVIIAVALGGALGALLRLTITHWARPRTDHPHLATLAINILGSLALGAVLAWCVARPNHLPHALQLGITAGLLGALTTYSTFATEAVALLREGHPTHALGYILATTILALLGAWLGYTATAAAFPATP